MENENLPEGQNTTEEEVQRLENIERPTVNPRHVRRCTVCRVVRQ